MRPVKVLFVLCLVVAIGSAAFAHEVRPAYLELRETGPETCDILWKVPARGELRLGLYVELPADCASAAEPRRYLADDAFTERWSVSRAGGLTGATIRIAGLSATATDVLVRIERLDGTTQVTRLTPAHPSFVVAAAPSKWEVAGTYFLLGIEHILLGIDHLLFVLALLILVKGWKKLVGTITAFTVAHSITLAAATLGLVNVPGPPVEATIALSIAFIACEIVHRRQDRSGWTERWPWVVAFTFGLLHGFGFAGALREVGLPENAIPMALLFFNVGVEAGQLLFIAGALLVFTAAVRVGPKLLRPNTRPRPAFSAWETVVAYGLGSVACFWLVERIVRFAA